MYHDPEGDCIWCFSCQKKYKPSDIYRKHLNRTGSLVQVANALWNQLSPASQQTLLSDFGRPVSYLPDGWEEARDKLMLFKKGKITFEQHLELLKQF